MTVSMYLAQKGIIPPKEWIHDFNIKNNYNLGILDYM